MRVIAALAMTTQHKQMYASHMNFDAFVVFMREFHYFDPKNFKGKFSPEIERSQRSAL